MNTKPTFFLCFLFALLFISALATEPSKDATEEQKIDPELYSWRGGHGGGWSGGHGGGWHGGGGGHGGWHGGGGHGGWRGGGGGGGHGGGRN